MPDTDDFQTALKALRECLNSAHLTSYAESRIKLAIIRLERISARRATSRE